MFPAANILKLNASFVVRVADFQPSLPCGNMLAFMRFCVPPTYGKYHLKGCAPLTTVPSEMMTKVSQGIVLGKDGGN